MPALSAKAIPAYFLLCLVLLANALYAAPIDSVTAKKAATGFYSQNYATSNINLSLAYTAKDANGMAEYYIYNVNTNDGYVIVTADDAAHPIIGYSAKGHYRNIPQPSNIAYWFKHYAKQVDYIRLHHLAANSDIQNEWTAYKNNQAIYTTERTKGSAVAPLLSTQWAQAPYYNDYCPDSCVAGCIATAMGQIMKYWAFPPHGIDTVSYTDPPYGSLSANLDTSNYDWAAMPTVVDHPNAQVAKLTYDIGVTVFMAYTPDESGAYMISNDARYDDENDNVSSQSAYAKNFGYKGSTLQGLYRSDYSSTVWLNMLENELNNKRPLQYAGEGNQGAHSWVIDGYDNAGNFHMNWGWGGYADSPYYNLNDLNPGNPPTPLDSDEEALIGIEPSAAVADFKGYPLIIRAGDTVHFTDNSFGTAPVTAWQWSLPGSAIGSTTQQNPIGVYATPGSYNVSETVTTGDGTGTTTKNSYITVLENDAVNVYPSVNDGNFTIQLHDGSMINTNIQFSLFDVLGHKMYTTALNQFITRVNVNLPHGVYFFRADNSDNTVIANGKLIMW